MLDNSLPEVAGEADAFFDCGFCFGHGSAGFSLEIAQKLGALPEKCRQIVLDDAPNQSIVDDGVLVGELISKADDLWSLIDLGKLILVSLRELVECFADDCELPLHRRANQAALAVVIEADASNGLLDGLTSLDHIAEEGPRSRFIDQLF